MEHILRKFIFSERSSPNVVNSVFIRQSSRYCFYLVFIENVFLLQPLPSEAKVPYRVPDPAGSKVHSIQVGNVLQIVPTELQPSSQGPTKVSRVSITSFTSYIPNACRVVLFSNFDFILSAL